MTPDVTCPECAAGKHRNCTVTVLVDDDTEVQCVCAAFDHEPVEDDVDWNVAVSEHLPARPGETP